MPIGHYGNPLNLNNTLPLISPTAQYFSLDGTLKSDKGISAVATGVTGAVPYEISQRHAGRLGLWITDSIINIMSTTSAFLVDSNADGLCDNLTMIAQGTLGTDTSFSVLTSTPWSSDIQAQVVNVLTTGSVRGFYWGNSNSTAYCGNTYVCSADIRQLTGAAPDNVFIRVKGFDSGAAQCYQLDTQLPSPSNTYWGRRTQLQFTVPAIGSAGNMGSLGNVATANMEFHFRSSVIGSFAVARPSIQLSPWMHSFNTGTGAGPSYLTLDPRDVVATDAGTIAFWYTQTALSSQITSGTQVHYPKAVQVGSYFANSSLTIWNFNNSWTYYAKGPVNSGWDAAYTFSAATTGTSYAPEHIAVTWQGRSVFMYRNGVQVGVTVLPSAFGKFAGSTMDIGMATSSNYGMGIFEDLVLDKKCWTPAQVEALYLASASPYSGANHEAFRL